MKAREIYSSDLSRQCKMEKNKQSLREETRTEAYSKAKVNSRHTERDEVYLKNNTVRDEGVKHQTFGSNQKPHLKSFNALVQEEEKKNSHISWQCYKPKPPERSDVRLKLRV